MRKERGKRGRTRRDEPNGGLETCTGDRDAEQNAAVRAKVMRCNMGEHIAAVGIDAVDGAALCTDVGEREIDERHEQRAETAREDRAVGEIGRRREAKATDGVDEDAAIGESSEHIHRIIALEQPGEKGILCVRSCGRHRPHAAHRLS